MNNVNNGHIGNNNGMQMNMSGSMNTISNGSNDTQMPHIIDDGLVASASSNNNNSNNNNNNSNNNNSKGSSHSRAQTQANMQSSSSSHRSHKKSKSHAQTLTWDDLHPGLTQWQVAQLLQLTETPKCMYKIIICLFVLFLFVLFAIRKNVQ